jgi:broad specificity phosphatase PhoE
MAGAAGWDVEVTTDPGWDEFDHLAVVAAYPDAPAGELDRRAFQQVFERATARWTGGGSDEEYAEPWPAFRDRVGAALGRATGAAGPGGTVVVVSSGGPIAAAGAALVDPDADDRAFARMWGRLNAVLVNSSVSRVVVGSTGARLLSWNDHAHVAGETMTYR